VRKRWPFLVAAPKHKAKKKSFRLGPRIVSDNDRSTLLIVDSWLPPYASPCRTPVFQVPGKSQGRKFTAAMAIPAPKKHAGRHTLRATFTEGEGEPGHDNRNQGQPRAMVLVNACCRTLMAFSQRDWPRTCANAADARSETDFFRKAFFIAGEFLSDDASRAPHRDQRPWGSPAAARRNFNFRLPTLTVLLNQVRREVA
jgi:hypothetical protein